jgi:hypothetical protein
MVRLRFPLLASIVVVGLACRPLPAQTSSAPTSGAEPGSAPAIDSGTVKHLRDIPAPIEDIDSAGKHHRTLPEPGLFPPGVPFAIESKNREYARSIGVVPAADISRQDQDLIADAQSTIQEKAGFENLEFNEGAWTYEKLECPALPGHLFLRFSRNNGTRDMSQFSAAIPRNGQGTIRIIPILRRGYSLFSPAPIGPLTIAAFNRIRKDENPDPPAEWLGTGLCYAALAGANPQAGQVREALPDKVNLPDTLPPMLVLPREGGAVIRFVDVSATPRPMEWNMTFNDKGKLLKATHTPAYLNRYNPRTLRTIELSDATKPDKKP